MNLKDIKEVLLSLPDSLDEYELVNGEVGYLSDGDNDDVVYRVDKPIIALYVDESSKEICFFHQTQEDVKKTLGNNYETYTDSDDNS